MDCEKKRFVIVGNCIAGVSAAETLRQHNQRDEIMMISDEDVPAYSRCLITYYLAGDVEESQLLSHSLAWYRHRDITLLLNTKALKVDPNKKELSIESKKRTKRIAYDNLLLATGASPIFFNAFPYDPDGIIGMRTSGDAKKLKSWAKKGKKALIIGAGFVGLKTAYGLSKLGVKTQVVELLPTVLGRMTDLEASNRVVNRLTSESKGNIEIKLNSSVVGVSRVNTRTGTKYRAAMSDGAEAEVDFIVASVGVRANTDLVQGTAIHGKGPLQVDERQKTAARDVYAAGDVAQSRHIVSKGWIYNAIWPVAAAQGRVAAHNMLGMEKVFAGNLPMNSVDFFHLWITAIGDVQARDGIQCLKYETPAIYQKLLLKDNIPVGFMAVGNVDGSGVIRSMIEQKIPWDEAKKQPYAHLLPIVTQVQ
jgi:NAD(P)H-nitrite reductase large subunit